MLLFSLDKNYKKSSYENTLPERFFKKQKTFHFLRKMWNSQKMKNSTKNKQKTKKAKKT